MKTPQKIPKYIEDFMNDLDWFFDLSYYDKNIVIKEKDPESGAVAEIEITESYRQVTLRIYPKFFTLSRKEQVDCLVHEYVHHLLVPLQIEADKPLENKFTNQERLSYALEKVVSSITERFIRLFNNQSTFIRKGYKKAISK